MRVFVTGGTGLIGSKLVASLREKNHEIVLLSRRPETVLRFKGVAEVVTGDAMQTGVWQERAAECDAIINLAGEGIFNRRWSRSFKALIRDSRVNSTEHCAQAVIRQPVRASHVPKVLINASAVGWYGPHGDEEIDESASNGSDFLAGICREWEDAARGAAQAGVRVVLARIGVVLDKAGGALKKMIFPFKMGGGGPVASGRQYFPWVHHADVIGLLGFALENENLRGPMNVAAPNPVTNKQFSRALGRVLHRPAFTWMPGTMLRLLLGQAAEVITTGQRVLPRKALAAGFVFQFPDLEPALTEIMQS